MDQPDNPDVPQPHRAAASEPEPEPRDVEPERESADPATRTERADDYRARVERSEAIDAGCSRVERIEREVVTPVMRAIEAEDPSRYLAGFDSRLKERYRIEEKVDHDIQKRAVSAAAAFSTIKDAVRYTYCYSDEGYVAGVMADCERIKAAGFQYDDSRNWWLHDEYKGINSWWRVPEDGQLFEVQFHTRASLEAKESTHAAYERLRALPPEQAEVRELHELQRRITAKVPVPPGAADLSIS